MLDKNLVAKILISVLACFIVMSILYVTIGDVTRSIRALFMVFVYVFIIHHWFLKETVDLLKRGKRK